MSDAPKMNQDQKRPTDQTRPTRDAPNVTQANRERRAPIEGRPARGDAPPVGNNAADGAKGVDGKRDFLPPRESHHKSGSGLDGLQHLKDTLSSPDAQPGQGNSDKLNRLRDTLNPANPLSNTPGTQGRMPGSIPRAADGGARANSDQRGKASPADANVRPDANRERRVEREKKDSNDRGENDRIAHPKDGVGHGHNSSDFNPKALKDFINGQSKEMKDALKGGRAHVEVTGHASRDGDSDHNKTLSDQRADKVGKAIQEQLGLDPSRVLTQGTGESDAKAAGHPDGQDNADDRVTDVKFVLDRDAPKPDDHVKGDVNAAAKAASDALPPTEKDRNAQEQLKMASDAAKNFVKDTAKEALKNPAAAEEIAMKNLLKNAGKLGAQELQWAGKKLAQDIGDKKMLEKIQAQEVPGMKDALSDFGGVKRDWHAYADPNNFFYKLAYNSYSERLNKLSDGDAKNLKTVLRSDEQRRDLGYKLEKNFSNFNSRGTFQHD